MSRAAHGRRASARGLGAGAAGLIATAALTITEARARPVGPSPRSSSSRSGQARAGCLAAAIPRKPIYAVGLERGHRLVRRRSAAGFQDVSRKLQADCRAEGSARGQQGARHVIARTHVSPHEPRTSPTVPGPANSSERNFTPLLISRVGDDAGFVTGYYEPIVDGSRVQTEVYNVPVYRRPSNLFVRGYSQANASMPNKGQVFPQDWPAQAGAVLRSCTNRGWRNRGTRP